VCREGLKLEERVDEEGEIKQGRLHCVSCDATFAIVDFIPRFVGDDNYARSFGFQWNKHDKTLIDKFNGSTITRDRFFAGTKWKPEESKRLSVLEAGCGSGRFTEIMLDAGFDVYSLDYSNAVDACLSNHGLNPNLHIIQGNIYEIPYAEESFDRVFCFGVLQHTPDVRKSFETLVKYVRPGGKIAVDVYPNTWTARMHYPRYVLRPLTKRLSPRLLYALVAGSVPILLPLSIALKSIPLIGRYLYPLVPVANYWRDYPLEMAMQKEWSIIDTFDWLGCWYDQPQTAETMEKWCREAGLINILVEDQGSYVCTAEKPV